MNCVRFSPDGALLCSVSSDGKAVLYDGTSGEVKGHLGGDKAHGGGIYAVSGGMCGVRGVGWGTLVCRWPGAPTANSC